MAARVMEFVKHLIVLFASVVITMVSGGMLAEIIVSTRRFGHQINIPNQELAKLDIENIGRRPFYLIH
jgi:hypothetical protein